MRKIWRKLLTVALVGALVSNVACKDYDDDIDRIDDKLEELSGTVALKTDVQQLQQTVATLNSIDFSAFLRSADFEARLQQAGVAYKSDLKAWLTGPEVKEMIENYGYQTAEQVKAQIEGLQNADDVAATFDAMIAAYDLWGAVQNNVTNAIDSALAEADFMTGESALSSSQVNQLLQTISAAFGAQGTDVKAAIDGWLGQDFAKYMESYEPTDAFIAKLGIGDASIAAVLGELKNANSDLVKEVKKLIVDATDGKVSEETLNTRFGEYDKKIEALSIRVAELEGRIQSLVWVPETFDEIRNNQIHLADRVTLDLTKEGEKKPKTIVLSESTKTLTWQVTPASVCKKIAPENVSIELKSVTRAAGEPLQIAGAAIDPAEGTIAVTISTDNNLWDNYYETSEYPAIALHVVVPGHKEEGENGAQYQGIDFLSNYTLVVPNSTQALDKRSFRFAKGEKDFYFGYDGVMVEHDYTNKEAQRFLDGFAVVAPDKDAEQKTVYTDVAKLYEAFGEQGALKIVCTPEVGADKKPVKATVEPKSLEKYLTRNADDFAVKTIDKSLHDARVYSGEYTCSIEGVEGSEYEGYGLELGTFRMCYRLVKTTVEMTVPAMQYDWTYANWSNNRTYTSKEVAVSGLTVTQYKEAKYSNFNLNLYNGDERVNASVNLTLTTTPTADTDVQWATLTIRDWNNAFAEGGEYVVKGECELDECRVKVEIPVTVKAMPELKGIAPAAKEYSFDGQYVYELIGVEVDKEGNVVDDYVAQLWAANMEIVKGQITEKEFAEMLANPENTISDTNEGKAMLKLVEGAVMVEFAPEALNDNKSYKPSLLIKHASGLECAIEAQGVKLTKPEVTWKADPAYIANGRAEMKTVLSGLTFEIEQKDMSKAYSTEEGCDLTYSIYNEEGSAQAKALAAMEEADKPTIVDGYLSWNKWAGLELIIKVEAKKSGVLLGTTTFTAYINDPVGAMAIDKKADNTIYAGESKNAGSVVNLLASDKRDCFNEDGKLNEELASAFSGKVTYAKVGDNWSSAFTLGNDGTVKVAESSIEIVKDMEIKVKVTYTYQFGKKEQEVTLVVKKGVRPPKEENNK